MLIGTFICQLSMDLFYVDKVNYARWGSVFLQDCLIFLQTHPSIHAEFMKGGFVVKNTSRQFSCVAIDQALEKNYNKVAKDHGSMASREGKRRWHNMTL